MSDSAAAIEQQLREIIVRISETTRVDFGPDEDLRNDLGIDSHRAIELVFEIERTFKVTIPATGYTKLRTLRSAIGLITSLQAPLP